MTADTRDHRFGLETPPGRVLKAWRSQGNLEKARTWRSLRPSEVRVVRKRVVGWRLGVIEAGVDLMIDIQTPV